MKYPQVEWIHDKKQLQEVTDYLKKQKFKATDIESSTISPYATHRPPQVGCVGFAANKERAFVYPLFSRIGVSIRVSIEETLEAVRELWEDEEAEYTLHFGKLDYTYMAVRHGIWLQGFRKHPTGYSYDTGQMSYCINELNVKGLHDLKTWAWRLGMGGYELKIEEYERTHQDANRKLGNLLMVPGNILYPYCGRDCVATFRLFRHLKKKLVERNLWENPFLFPQMCLSGDTKLWSPEGDKSLKTLAKQFKLGKIGRWPVYAVHPNSGRMSISWASIFWKTGIKKKKIVQLTFDDGSKLKFTPDHIVWIRKQLPCRKDTQTGRFVAKIKIVLKETPVSKLKVGDCILATQRFIDSHGYEFLKKNIYGTTEGANRQAVHRVYSRLLGGPFVKGIQVHHKNGIKIDNRRRNLQRLLHKDHSKLSVTSWKNSLSPEEKLLIREKQSKAAKMRYALATKDELKAWGKAISAGQKASVETRNHKIVKIERLPPEPVYDFTVPDYHAAVVGTGVVVHNCHNWTASILEITGIKTNLKRNDELKKEFPENIARVEADLLKFKSVQKLLKLRKRKVVERITDRVLAYKRKPVNPQALIVKFVKAELKRKPFKWTPDDRRTLIYTILKYKVEIRTQPSKTYPEGQPSIDKKATVRLLRSRLKNKVLEKLMERGIWYYGLTKYVKPIPSWVGSDSRTHTTYKPQGQRTGRVGSANPDHENLPKHNEVAPRLRSQFVPTSEKYVFLAGDGKQMELRLMADRANDDRMKEEFEQGKDPHAMGAMAMNELTEKQWLAKPEDVRKTLRKDAKSAVSFGLVYGRSAEALAADFGKPVSWAEEKKERYFGKYDDIPKYWEQQEEFAREHKYVLSHFGRRRHLPDIDSERQGIVNKEIRRAINSPIQGDSSDLIWIAGYRLLRWLLKYKLRSKVLVTDEDRKKRFMFYRKSRNAIHIHDDVTVDCYIPELPDVTEKLAFFMRDREYVEKHTGWFCSVPLDLDLSIYRHDLGTSVELARKGDEFIIPKL